MGALAVQPQTIDDLYAIPEAERYHELLAGEIVPKASPSFRHSRAQRRLGSRLDSFDRKPRGPKDPGGWWIVVEPDVQLAPHTLVRPDVAGWRREHLPEPPERTPIQGAPDWICEVLSRSNAAVDLLDKVRIYHRANIAHYWILDPERQTLRVHRWTPTGYQVILDAASDERVRAEPFELLDLLVLSLFDDEDT